MKTYSYLYFFVVTLFISGCAEDDPAPKCTTKAISYQEFKDYQKSQNTWKSSVNLEKK